MDLAILILIFAAIAFFVLIMTMSSKRDRANRAARQRIREQEQARLEEIRNAMTPAEWELYVVQLEILRVLRSQSKSKSSSYSYGFAVSQGD